MRQSTDQRTERILHQLLREGSVEVEDLASALGVSSATVRRELRDLEGRGLLRRTHGGAVAVESALYEPFRYDASFQEQEALRTEEKRRIGLAAASLVREGETIALSAGTTATQVARCLRHRSGITLITNAVNVAMELSRCPGLTVILTGGVLSGGWFSLLGPLAIRSVEEFNYDRAFVGLDGIHADHGMSSHHPDEAALNRAMVRQAKQTVAVADHTKVGKVARAQVCPLSAIDLLITGAEVPDDEASELGLRGLTVRQV
ncbi:MAG TPA: DeoR/GlpR family DNA-binding transcription regulator [Armatimonadota bacterium]|jgi:DeoR family transcriptional regulator of aga operon